MRAPGRIAHALTVAEVVDDLAATATLVRSGGGEAGVLALDRGDDGVTFSGFLECNPGQYTLEIVFRGTAKVDGARHFLGRITSDSFTVTAGQSVTPAFNAGLDTVGREGDDGDSDGDALGFLDELLLETNPNAGDSDGDGVADGADCTPADDDGAFTIAEGGSFIDCDADGFVSVDAPFGEPGEDCDDEDGAVHPGVDDDCANDVDQDCNPQTCPIADFEGPEIEPIDPVDGDTIGCNAPIVVEATDPSDVNTVLVQAPDYPFPGGTPRTIALVQDAADESVWRAANGFGGTGAGIADGPTTLTVTASDTSGNSNTAALNVTFALAFPEVTMTGPGAIGDGETVDVTVTPVAGGRPLASLELHAAPLLALDQLDMENTIVVDTLPVAGGTVSVSADELPAPFVVYPVAVDDVGNAMAPQPLGAFFSTSTGGITASFLCDGASHSVPGIPRRAGALGPTLMREHLAEATAIAQGINPDAFLVKIIGFGVNGDGAIDLGDTSGQFIGWIYGFMTPERILEERGISVTWYAAGFLFGGQQNPVVNADDGGTFQIDALTNVNAYPDSDVIADAYPCGGTGWTGNDDDTLIIVRDEGSGTNDLILDTLDGYAWGVTADNLNVDTFGCSCPDGVVCP